MDNGGLGLLDAQGLQAMPGRKGWWACSVRRHQRRQICCSARSPASGNPRAAYVQSGQAAKASHQVFQSGVGDFLVTSICAGEALQRAEDALAPHQSRGVCERSRSRSHVDFTRYFRPLPVTRGAAEIEQALLDWPGPESKV